MPNRLAVDEAIKAMVDAVNRGDTAAARSRFADAAVIVEDIPPFCWRGPDVVSRWLAAMTDSAARLEVASISMVLGEPVRIEVDGDRSYALFPGTLAMHSRAGDYAADGQLTFTLSAEGDHWLIDTLTWSGPNPRRG